MKTLTKVAIPFVIIGLVGMILAHQAPKVEKTIAL